VKHFGLISNHDFTSTLRDISESNEEKDIQSSQTPSISALNCFSLPKGLVVMSIGGGHYVPKMNDMVRKQYFDDIVSSSVVMA
jgi:D-tyrosyl-tRNA(Tyr) deacylase